jgi:hypothetical protein
MGKIDAIRVTILINIFLIVYQKFSYKKYVNDVLQTFKVKKKEQVYKEKNAKGNTNH